MEIVSTVRQTVQDALTTYQAGQVHEAHRTLFDMNRVVRSHLEHLPELARVPNFGKAYTVLTMLHKDGDVDELQQIASIGYLALSLAMEQEPSETVNLTRDRYLLLFNGEDGIEWTISTALPSGKPVSPLFFSSNVDSQFNRRSKFLKLLYSDQERIKSIAPHFDMVRQGLDEFDDLLKRDYFGRDKTRSEVLSEGEEHHKKLQDHLYEQLVVEQDYDF